MSLYTNMWLSRLVKVGFSMSFLHLGFLLSLQTFLWAYENLESLLSVNATAPGVPHSNWVTPQAQADAIGLELLVPIFKMWMGTVFSHLTFWMFLASFTQTWIMATFAQVARTYPPTRRDFALMVCGCTTSQTFLSILLIGFSSATLFHCHMTPIGFGVMQIEPPEACPTMAGPSALCWDLQYREILCFIALLSIIAFYVQFFQLDFVVSFPTIGVPVGDRTRFALYAALIDSINYIRFVFLVFGSMLMVRTSAFMATSEYMTNVMKYGVSFNTPYVISLLFWPSFLIYSTKLCWRLVEVTFTEPLNLAAESQYPNSTGIVSLSEAMSSPELRIKYFGFCEFNLLACTPGSAETIKEFFILSHPGRHARNWMGVLNATLSECHAMINALKIHMHARRGGRSAPSTAAAFSATLMQQPENGQQQQNNLRRRTQTQMRDLTAPVVPQVLENNNAQERNVLMLAPQMLKTAFQRMLNHWWNTQIAPKMASLKAFANEKDMQYELSNIISSGGQLIMWGTNSIVELSSVSFAYDNHGIVQREMQRIIEILLHLYDVLIEVAQALAEIPRDEGSPPNLDLADALLRQLITGLSFNLSRIHQSFNTFYGVLSIPEDQVFKLQTLSLSKYKQVTIFPNFEPAAEPAAE